MSGRVEHGRRRGGLRIIRVEAGIDGDARGACRRGRRDVVADRKLLALIDSGEVRLLVRYRSVLAEAAKLDLDPLPALRILEHPRVERSQFRGLEARGDRAVEVLLVV